MSHEDSLDEETKRLLAEVNSDDSKESKTVIKKNEQPKDTETEIYDYSDDKEIPDEEW